MAYNKNSYKTTKWINPESQVELPHPQDDNAINPLVNNLESFEDYQLSGGSTTTETDPPVEEPKSSNYSKLLGTGVFTSTETFNARKNICRSCPHAILNKWVCGKCYCPIANKALIKSDSCPVGKWSSET